MSIRISASLVNGDLWDPLEENTSGEDAVLLICGDDTGPPVTSLVVRVTTESLKVVEVLIPNSESRNASVRIDGKAI
jgi:hypothetical protein